MFKVILKNIIEKTILSVDTGKLPSNKAEEMTHRIAKTQDGKNDFTVVAARPDGSVGTHIETTGGFGVLKIDADKTVTEATEFGSYQVFTKGEKVVASIDICYIVGIIEEK